MSSAVFFVESHPPKFYASEPLIPSSIATVSRCMLEYLSEGGANFVFKILPAARDEALPETLQGKLLRLRKDLPHVQCAEDQLRALDDHFRSLFPAENLVQHALVAVEQGVPDLLNANLQKLVRPGHRSGDYLPAEDMSGLLITDMSAGDGDVVVSLKPKWLTQSPNAPPEARRCRTCAIRAQRASERTSTATDAQASCPLDLINGNVEDRKAVIFALTMDRRVRDYLVHQAQPLLQQLRATQMSFDADGILKTSGAAQIQDLCKAMTLRDCTLFVKRSGNRFDARLADLDLKQPQKLPQWKRVERSLIDAGWYTNSEHDKIWKREKICLLSRLVS